MLRIRVGTSVLLHYDICYLGGMDMKLLRTNNSLVGLIDQIAPGRKQGPLHPTQDFWGVFVLLAFYL